MPFAPADMTTIFLALTARGVCLAVMNSGFGTVMAVNCQPPEFQDEYKLNQARTKFGVALILNTNGLLVVVKQDSHDLLLAYNMQVGVVAALELVVYISVSSILSPSVRSDVLQPSFGGIVRVKVLQVLELAVAHLVG